MFTTRSGNKKTWDALNRKLLLLHEQRFNEIKCINPLKKQNNGRITKDKKTKQTPIGTYKFFVPCFANLNEK